MVGDNSYGFKCVKIRLDSIEATPAKTRVYWRSRGYGDVTPNGIVLGTNSLSVFGRNLMAIGACGRHLIAQEKLMFIAILHYLG